MIIMVIRMPKMGGIEAMRRVLCKHKDIPIIIHTAYSHYKEKFMSWAADSYIVKSSDLTELKKTINDLLTKKKSFAI
ncbi:MAG: response regulator [Candidatus Scalindua sp.]|nr:response regulator [Candidatus Scalindua sp.]